MSQYYPHLLELVLLSLIVLQVIWAGHIIRSFWNSRNEPVPVSVAVFMFIGMIAVYILITFIFSMSVPEGSLPDPTLIPGADGVERYVASEPVTERRFLVMFWCIVFWVFPAVYYINILRNSFAQNAVDRIGPFSAQIEMPSEFAEARRLALRGDIEGAVGTYRKYEQNRAGALLEAARLLKSHDRFAEAALLFEEIAERYGENLPVWAEATLQLARIHEANLRDKERACELYESIIDRAPETRFAQAADTDLTRMAMMSGEAYASIAPIELDRDDDDGLVEAAERLAEIPRAERKAAILADDHPEPPVDPFFSMRMRRSPQIDAALSGGNHKDAAPKKPAPKKSAAAKKKAPAKAAAKPAPKKKRA